MKSLSLRKLSMLGLVLMAASAVTAAILPDKAPKAKVEGDDNGTLREDQTGSVVTCVARDGAASCNVTVGTTTTGNQGNSFTGLLNTDQTQTNTSQSAFSGHPASSNAV
jgi:uncharacterized protein (DUF2147 family)